MGTWPELALGPLSPGRREKGGRRPRGTRTRLRGDKLARGSRPKERFPQKGLELGLLCKAMKFLYASFIVFCQGSVELSFFWKF